MLNVRYDYGFLGKLFGVPRKLLSQLGGFCTSFTVEGRILKATFPAFPVPDKNPVRFWLDEEELAAFIEEQGGATPEDLTHDDITDWDAATADFLDGDDYDAIIGAVEDVVAIVDGILADYLSSADVGVIVAEENHTHTHDDITDWGTATADFLTDADMSAYALDADLSALEEDVADIADVVDAIDADLYDASGNKTWVDTTTAQTVGGIKTFTNGTWFRNSANIGVSDGSRMNISSWSIEIYPPNTSTHGGYIDFHYAGSSEDWTSRVIDDSNGLLLCTKKKVRLTSGSGYYAELDKVPADDSATNSVRIATLGWVNNYFSRKSHNHDEVYSKLGHTHSGYATTNHTHSGYALSNHNHAGVYADVTHQHVASDITDLGAAVDAKINTFSNTLSGVYAPLTEFNQLSSLVNEIDIDLADVTDYVDSMDEDIADLASWHATGRTGTLTLGGVVSWTGTQLKQDKHVVTFTSGLITNVVTTAEMVIDTPVLFEQS